MPDKSNFKNGVPATGSDFQFESESRIKDHQRTTENGLQTGILEGLVATVNGSDPTKIDIEPGNGYVGDVDFGDKSDSVFGSYIKYGGTAPTLDGPGPWVAGTPYYVCAVYNEDVTIERPNEDGTTLEDVRTESSTIDCTFEIITVTDYLALSDIDKHKRLKLARIVPSGTSLVADDIENSYVVERVKTAGTLALTGVEVLEVSPTATDGTSEIDWNQATTELKWKDAAGSFGSPVDISTDGIHTLESATTTRYIKVRTTLALLPSSSGTFDLEISDLYEGVIRPGSGADRLLRSYGGSALKTQTNPLGLSVDDLGPGVGEDIKSHRLYMHKNGIVSDNDNTLKASIIQTDEDYLSLGVLAGADRFFIKGSVFSQIIESQNPAPAGNQYTLQFVDLGTQNWVLCEVYVDELGTLRYNDLAQIDDNAKDIEGLIILDLRLETYTGTFNIVYDYETEKRTLQFNSGEVVTLIPDVDATYELIGSNGFDRILVYVDWDELEAVDDSELWTINNAPLDGLEDSLKICNIVYYNQDLYGENVDYDTGGGTPYDLRQFGTLGEENFRDDTKEYIEFAGREILNNGVIQGFFLEESPANTLKIGPGRGFVRGKEVQTTSDETIDFSTGYADGNWYVWLSQDGTIEALAEPLDGSSNVLEDVLTALTNERVLLAKVSVLSDAIDSWVNKIEFVGIGETKDENDGLGARFPEIVLKKSPNYSGGRIIKLGDELYIVKNLRRNYDSGLWEVEDSSKYGVAIVEKDTSSGSELLAVKKLNPDLSPSANLSDTYWPESLVKPFFKEIFGDGSDGDKTVSSNENLNDSPNYAKRIWQFKNLTINDGIELTGNGPFLVIGVQEKLTIEDGGKISLDGIVGVTGTLALGGEGKGGLGGTGNHGDPGFVLGIPGKANGIKEFGTCTSTVAFGLNDTSALFQSKGVQIGDIVYNRKDNTTALVTGFGVNPEQTLLIDTDIFVSEEPYAVGYYAHFASDGVGMVGGNYTMPFSLSGGGGGGGGGGSSGGYGGGGGGIGGNGGEIDTVGDDGKNSLSDYNLKPEIDFFSPEFIKSFVTPPGCKGWGGGGGGGGRYGTPGGGGGGGGGGAIYIEAQEIEIPAFGTIFSADGGGGGDGQNLNYTTAGGGGGGGGSVVIICNESNLTASQMFGRMSVNGGSGGNGYGVRDGGIGGVGLKMILLF
jgi:hypothetical protein